MKIDIKSIAFRLTSLIIVIIIGQATLLSMFLILGGVISQAEQNAFTSFTDKVRNRKDYLQREMKYHWTNLDPYVEQISDRYLQEEEPDQFFQDISHSLISMLRTTQATGAFVIMENHADKKEKAALYIRDYDPILNDYDNRDLYLIFGPSGLASNLQMPLDQMWKHRMDLNTIDSDFYEKPLSKASLSSNSSLLGYWSLPFQLFSEDISIITYTMPLFDKNKELIGIIGVEVSEQYLSKFLPATDLQKKDSYGYMIGYKQPDKEGIEAIILTKAIQKRIINSGNILNYSNVDDENSVYLVNNQNSRGKIYVAIEHLGLYSNNTPFQQNQWYLIGIMGENHLLSYVTKIKYILMFSLVSSVIIGLFFGYILSYKFTRPIIKVAKKVKETNAASAIGLENTGLTEVDELTKAIQIASNMLLENSGKMSKIIEMVGLPLGVFEYADNKDEVFVTDQLLRLLSIEAIEMEKITGDKERFIEIIQKMLSQPEEEEEDIYYICDAPDKWLRIKYTKKDNITIGVIMDVTDEMAEKKKILIDRDIDPLTGIYNRKAMQLHMEEAISDRKRNLVSAILMLDLDNLKTINDTYGHKWGDIYINHVVKHLSDVSENHQILGRRSGDEFALLIYDYESKNQIRMCIDNFYLKLQEDKLIFPDGNAKPAMISAGLIWINDNDFTFDEYLQKADELLYDAKRYNKGYYIEANLS